MNILKKLTIMTLVFGCMSTFALPLSTKDLIIELSSSGILSEVLKKEKSPIREIKIENLDRKTALEMVIDDECYKLLASRSSSALKLEVIYAPHRSGFSAAVHSSTHYFASSGEPNSLKACQ